MAVFKGRAIKPGDDGYSPHEYGQNGETLELLLQMNVPELGRTLTTPLYFSAAAAPYSFERLRACGWEGTDIRNLVGVDKNEVAIEYRVEVYEGKARPKVQILTGGGQFKSSHPLSPAEFAAKLQATTGKGMGNGGGGDVEKPPFIENASMGGAGEAWWRL